MVSEQRRVWERHCDTVTIGTVGMHPCGCVEAFRNSVKDL